MPVTINLPTETTMLGIKTALEQISGARAVASEDWTDVRNAVVRGVGAYVYPVGTQFEYTHPVYGAQILDVIGHDVDLDPTGRMSHSMTLLHHYAVDSLPFDAQEALFISAGGVSAGAHFWNDNGVSRTFTLTNAIADGGCIVISAFSDAAPYGATELKVYSSRSAAEAVETVSVSEGSAGTELVNINYWHRARWGSGRWKDSDIRLWLNSAAAAGAWWTASGDFSRPPSSTFAAKAGFLNGFPEGLLDVLGAADHVTAKNTLTDGGGCETTRDRVFLLSQKELTGTGVNSQAEGSRYAYFGGTGDAQYIKYNHAGTALAWMLRSPVDVVASSCALSSATGALSSSRAVTSNGIAPAFVIY